MIIMDENLTAHLKNFTGVINTDMASHGRDYYLIISNIQVSAEECMALLLPTTGGRLNLVISVSLNTFCASS